MADKRLALNRKRTSIAFGRMVVPKAAICRIGTFAKRRDKAINC